MLQCQCWLFPNFLDEPNAMEPSTLPPTFKDMHNSKRPLNGKVSPGSFHQVPYTTFDLPLQSLHHPFTPNAAYSPTPARLSTPPPTQMFSPSTPLWLLMPKSLWPTSPTNCSTKFPSLTWFPTILSSLLMLTAAIPCLPFNSSGA